MERLEVFVNSIKFGSTLYSGIYAEEVYEHLKKEHLPGNVIQILQRSSLTGDITVRNCTIRERLWDKKYQQQISSGGESHVSK